MHFYVCILIFIFNFTTVFIWVRILLSLSRSNCVYCSFYHCILFSYSASKLPVCFNKLTYLLTYANSLIDYLNLCVCVCYVVCYVFWSKQVIPLNHSDLWVCIIYVVKVACQINYLSSQSRQLSCNVRWTAVGQWRTQRGWELGWFNPLPPLNIHYFFHKFQVIVITV